MAVLPLRPEDAAYYPDKAFANARARAALAGCTLHRLEDDNGDELFIVTKGALTKHFSALSDVEPWLDRLAGKA